MQNNFLILNERVGRREEFGLGRLPGKDVVCPPITRLHFYEVIVSRNGKRSQLTLLLAHKSQPHSSADEMILCELQCCWRKRQRFKIATFTAQLPLILLVQSCL